MRNKRIALILALIMVLGALPLAFTSCEPKIQGQIIMGSSTELTGSFGNTAWDNVASDADIRTMTIGYETVTQTKEGEFVWDTKNVVASHEETENEDGTKTFKITIKDGLKFSDGSAITAKDYIAAILGFASPIKGDAGCNSTIGSSIVGYEEYSAAEAPAPFTGIRLYDDYTFSVTIKADYLPYYYDVTYASYAPYSAALWLGTDVEIKDDGEGAYLSDTWYAKADDGTYAKAAQLLTGRYATTDRPCSGPYKFENYDATSKTCTLVINDQYVGNFEGQTPHVAKVIYILIEAETQMDLLKTGGVDILTGLAEGSEIDAGLALCEDGTFSYASYLRSGYGRLMFVCDFGPSQFVEVRQAIAYLLDTQEFSKAFTGGYGGIVYGPYGLASWMYADTKDEIESKVNKYDYSAESVTKVLNDGGWIYNADGSDWDGTGIRYKKLEGEVSDWDKNFTAGTYSTVEVDGAYYMPLALEWIGGSAEVAELLTTYLVENPNTAAAGMLVNATLSDFGTLINYLYRDTSEGEQYGTPKYNMFTLGMGITAVYDFGGNYATKDGEHSMYYELYNNNKISDDLLDQYSWNMVYGVKSGDRDAFLEQWKAFILRFNEVLPDIALYANLYHDIYSAKIQNYDVNPYWEAASAILYCNIK